MLGVQETEGDHFIKYERKFYTPSMDSLHTHTCKHLYSP